MEIKIQCNCGTRYKFDVEPVDGRAPTELACPACGASWTDYTNAMIAQALAASVPAPSAAAAAPAGLVPPAPSPARISLRVAAPAAQPAPAASEASAAVGPEVPAPAPSGRPMPRMVGLNPVLEESKGNFGLGLLGAAIGSLVGSLIYFALFSYDAFYALKLMAIGVGLLAGLSGKLLAKEGCNELGIIAATLSVAGVVGAQYFVTRSWWHESSTMTAAAISSAYEEEVKEAKLVVAAVPNGTEPEIRAYLAKEATKEGEKLSPKEVDIEDVGELRDNLPRYRDLASGKLTKEDWEREQKAEENGEAKDAKKEKEEEERTFKWVFVALTFSRFNIACLVGAAGIAYKLGS
jgi:hypothetical protein